MPQPEPLKISIPKPALAELPAARFTGRIVVVDTREQALAALAALEGCTCVGFDTETKPAFKKGERHKVALVQISSHDTCWLFRVNRLGIMPELLDFFENPAVAKIGLSLGDDFKVMHRGSPFKPAGFIDLQHTVRTYSIADSSLQRIYGIVCGERISKSQRLTNWEAEALTPAQQHYAALDAWACLRLHGILTSGGFDPARSPYRVTEENTPAE